jgi:hypothetical protein
MDNYSAKAARSECWIGASRLTVHGAKDVRLFVWMGMSVINEGRQVLGAIAPFEKASTVTKIAPIRRSQSCRCAIC